MFNDCTLCRSHCRYSLFLTWYEWPPEYRVHSLFRLRQDSNHWTQWTCKILYIKSGRPYKPFTTVRLALCSSLTDAALLHYLFKSTDGITYLAMLVLDSWKLTPEAGVPNGFSGSIGVPTNTCILRRFTWGRGSSRLILGLVLFNCCNRKSQVIHKSR